MAFGCKIGLHNWEGCKCSKCNTISDFGHDWKKDCEKCFICGKIRENTHLKENRHKIEGCKCLICGKVIHEKSITCKSCGRILFDDLPTFIGFYHFETLPFKREAWYDFMLNQGGLGTEKYLKLMETHNNGIGLATGQETFLEIFHKEFENIMKSYKYLWRV